MGFEGGSGSNLRSPFVVQSSSLGQSTQRTPPLPHFKCRDPLHFDNVCLLPNPKQIPMNVITLRTLVPFLHVTSGFPPCHILEISLCHESTFRAPSRSRTHCRAGRRGAGLGSKQDLSYVCHPFFLVPLQLVWPRELLRWSVSLPPATGVQTK